jgi:hypothetical protein
VWSLILLLNDFIFIARVIILLLVGLVIIDLLYVFPFVMLDIIEEMLPNFSNMFLVGDYLWCLVASRGDSGFQGVTVGTKDKVIDSWQCLLCL